MQADSKRSRPISSPRIMVKQIDYSDGTSECVAFAEQRSVPRCHHPQGNAADPERSAAESLRRKKKQVLQYVKYNQLQTQITLTFPGAGVHDAATAYELFLEFKKKHGQVMGTCDTPWLAVPELHPSGHGFHWHVYVHGVIDRDLLQNKWTRFLRRRLPGIDKSVRVMVGVKHYADASQAANYARKDMADMAHFFKQTHVHRQQYLRSQGFNPLVKRTVFSDWKEALKYASSHRFAVMRKGYVDTPSQAMAWHDTPPLTHERQRRRHLRPLRYVFWVWEPRGT